MEENDEVVMIGRGMWEKGIKKREIIHCWSFIFPSPPWTGTTAPGLISVTRDAIRQKKNGSFPLLPAGDKP